MGSALRGAVLTLHPAYGPRADGPTRGALEGLLRCARAGPEFLEALATEIAHHRRDDLRAAYAEPGEANPVRAEVCAAGERGGGGREQGCFRARHQSLFALRRVAAGTTQGAGRQESEGVRGRREESESRIH